MEKYIPTGNERVSLPTIRESDGGIESISFLSMTLKGMLELRGNAESALMQPFLQAEDVCVDLPEEVPEPFACHSPEAVHVP